MKVVDVEKGLALYDLQYPRHNKKLLSNVERYMETQEWDYLIYGGDFADLDAISHHAYASGDIRSIEGKRLKKDYEEMSKILRYHRDIVGPHCKIYYLMGNHEEWAEKLVNKYPGLEGLIEIENNLPLADLDIEVVRPRGFIKLGKIHFLHGDIGGPYTPMFHAKKVVETYNRNVVYGHHHSLQVATKVSPFGIDETHSAYSLPALADIQPSWAGNRPNKWLNGFGIFYVTPQTFSVFPIVSAKDAFITPEGNYFG